MLLLNNMTSVKAEHSQVFYSHTLLQDCLITVCNSCFKISLFGHVVITYWKYNAAV